MYGPYGKILALIILWAIAFVLIVFLTLRNNIIKKVIVLLTIALFSFVVGYSDLLVDYNPYKDAYNSYSIGAIQTMLSSGFVALFSNEYEPLYLLAMLVFKRIGADFSFFLFFQTFIIQFVVLFVILPKKYDLYKSYLLFYLFCMFVPMGYRQFFADLLFLSTYFFSNIIFIGILCLIGSLYHFSNFVGFSRIVNTRVSPKNPFKVFIIVVILALVFRFGLAFVLENIGPENRLLFKLKYYLEYSQKWYDYHDAIHQIIHLLIATVLPISVIFVFFIYKSKLFGERRIYNSVFFAILIYIISIIIFRSYTLSYRLFLTLSLPMCLIGRESSKKQLFVLSTILIVSNVFNSIYYVFTYLVWG